MGACRLHEALGTTPELRDAYMKWAAVEASLPLSPGPCGPPLWPSLLAILPVPTARHTSDKNGLTAHLLKYFELRWWLCAVVAVLEYQQQACASKQIRRVTSGQLPSVIRHNRSSSRQSFPALLAKLYSHALNLDTFVPIQILYCFQCC
jgi:hypothetical protein